MLEIPKSVMKEQDCSDEELAERVRQMSMGAVVANAEHLAGQMSSGNTGGIMTLSAPRTLGVILGRLTEFVKKNGPEAVANQFIDVSELRTAVEEYERFAVGCEVVGADAEFTTITIRVPTVHGVRMGDTLHATMQKQGWLKQ